MVISVERFIGTRRVTDPYELVKRSTNATLSVPDTSSGVSGCTIESICSVCGLIALSNWPSTALCSIKDNDDR